MTIISERLQHLRLTHGYTQTELARTMGVTRRAQSTHGSTTNAPRSPI